MGTAIIIAIIVILCAYGIYSYMKKIRSGGGCCGEHEPTEKKVKVADRDKSHYSYEIRLSIDGMTCGNCARRVENALNRMGDVWAKVDLGGRQADVLSKAPLNRELLRKTILEAGYTVLSIEDCQTK